MFISSSTGGISVNWKCYKLRAPFRKKCPDEYTDKCYTCKYCRAEMPARDASRLLGKVREKGK